MSHFPVNHPLRPLYRIMAAFAGLYGEKMRREESELERLDPGFSSYRAGVPALIPARGSFARALATTRFDAGRLVRNREHVTAAGFAAVSVLLRFKQVYRW